MPTLNINKILIRNFRSYGDYDTEISLDNLGPVLIQGQTNGDPTKSNGAGKSTITDAMIWCLFGRVPSKQRPSSYVVNVKTGKDCLVKLTTKDGYIITRTRDMDGHSDLLINSPDGQDISDSTNINAQKHLDKLFDLDYDIFTTNVFFTQSGMSFMELPTAKRMKAHERMLNIDKFDSYAKSAKEKVDRLTTDLDKLQYKLDDIDKQVQQQTLQMEKNINLKDEHEQQRKQEVQQLTQKLEEVDQEYEQRLEKAREQFKQAKQDLAALQIVDIQLIQGQWDQYNQQLSKIEEKISRLTLIENEIIRLKERRENLKQQKQQQDLDCTTDQQQIQTLTEKLQKAETHDIQSLQRQWDAYQKHQDLIRQTDQSISKLDNKLIEIETSIRSEREHISQWKDKEGVCPNCGQQVGHDYVMEKSTPSEKALADLISKQQDVADKRQKLITARDKTKQQIKKPALELSEARLINEHKQQTKEQIDSIEDRIRKAKDKHQQQIKKLDDQLKEIETNLNNKIEYVKTKKPQLQKLKDDLKKPETSIEQARSMKAQFDIQNKQVKAAEENIATVRGQWQQAKDDIRSRIDDVKNKDNPYNIIIENQSKDLDRIKKSKEDLSTKADDLNKRIKYLSYIRSAYADRRKIKSHMLSRLIPFYNERIAYYLDVMECECAFQFNNALKVKYDSVPYELRSGGERKRIDLAMMFANHDLHTSIYDQQCNIVVFDEVDGRLDQFGINKFTEVIFNELSVGNDSGIGSILVISHKDQMRDMFPAKIIVDKSEIGMQGQSKILESR